MSTPQLIITLSPEDQLVIELPGTMGTRRKVEISPNNLEATVLRILRAQRESLTEIGLDGAPTIAQVEHWEKHEDWPSAKCRFCIAEGRIKGEASPRNKKRILLEKREDGVEVRKIRQGETGLGKKSKSEKTAKDLGL